MRVASPATRDRGVPPRAVATLVKRAEANTWALARKDGRDGEISICGGCPSAVGAIYFSPRQRGFRVTARSGREVVEFRLRIARAGRHERGGERLRADAVAAIKVGVPTRRRAIDWNLQDLAELKLFERLCLSDAACRVRRRLSGIPPRRLCRRRRRRCIRCFAGNDRIPSCRRRRPLQPPWRASA